ncbi:MAG TPA: heat-inducible transcriptional repressor HrcA [Candidatus Acidoferrales bacterium]
MGRTAQHEVRNRKILAAIVRTYIETGEPVPSATVAGQHREWSAATVRKAMAELGSDGLLDQPHTSAGRLPTAQAYRFYAGRVAWQARLSRADEELIESTLRSATTTEEILERGSHVLSLMSHSLGIVVSPPLAKVVLEFIRFILLPDGRILVVLASRSKLVEHRVITCDVPFTQQELDETANYLNRNFAGWSLETIGAEILRRVKAERREYDRLLQNAVLLCERGILLPDMQGDLYLEGRANMADRIEFQDQEKLHELLEALEQKEKLLKLFSEYMGPSAAPLHIAIGLEEGPPAMKHFALICAPYRCGDRTPGSVAILGPARLPYERAIGAVSYVARFFTRVLSEN